MSQRRALSCLAVLLHLLLCLAFSSPALGQEDSLPLDRLFGRRAVAHADLNDLPQWLGVMTRHLQEDRPEQPALKEWFRLLDELRGLPARTQLHRVNRFMNQKKYTIDAVNYGEEDYWAVVKEFMKFSGDCEDFSISKFFSLRLLGFPAAALRLVILQDTNLGISHAVLAVRLDNQVMILDNQSDDILTDGQIIHYTPLYAVNEERWWLFLPPM